MSGVTITPTNITVGAGTVAVPEAVTVKQRRYHGGGILSDEERATKRATQQSLQDQAVTLSKDDRAIVAAHRLTQDKPKEEKPVATPQKEADKPAVKAGDTTVLERANRIEARNRQREQKLAQLEQDNQKLQLASRELEELKNLSKSDQVTLMEKLGMDLETLGKAQVKAKRSPKAVVQEDPVAEVRKELDQIKQERSDQQQHQAFQAGLNQFAGDLQQAMTGQEVNYELVLENAKQPSQRPEFRNKALEDVAQLVEAARINGTPVSHKEALDQLEAYYTAEAEEQFNRLSASKKLQEKFGLSAKQADKAAAAATEEPTKKVQQRKVGYGGASLAGDKMKSPPSQTSAEKPKRLSDKDRLAAAIAWGKKEYAKQALARAGGQ